MTTSMQDIERAYELGRAAERQKMADLASLMSNEKLATLTSVVSGTEPALPQRMRARQAARAAIDKAAARMKDDGVAVDPKAKSRAIARGVKKAGAPRTRGVKDRIMGAIASASLTTAQIIATTGDKESSVVGTLQGLKKKGIASMGEGKQWRLIAPVGGNSETAHAGGA